MVKPDNQADGWKTLAQTLPNLIFSWNLTMYHWSSICKHLLFIHDIQELSHKRDGMSIFVGSLNPISWLSRLKLLSELHTLGEVDAKWQKLQETIMECLPKTLGSTRRGRLKNNKWYDNEPHAIKLEMRRKHWQMGQVASFRFCQLRRHYKKVCKMKQRNFELEGKRLEGLYLTNAKEFYTRFKPKARQTK